MMMTNNLLGCPIKETVEVDIGTGLMDLIQSKNTNNCDFDSIKSQIGQIRSMRRSVEAVVNRPTLPTSAANSLGQSCLNTLISYYAHLTYISTKFPTDIGVQFTYYLLFSDRSTTNPHSSVIPGDLLRSSNDHISSQNIHFERGSVLFNIASISSILGASQPRSSIDQLKRAISLFQQAAGCFSYLRESIIDLIDSTSTGSIDAQLPPDLSRNSLLALEYLSLAQAQECGWQSSVIGDKVKNASVSKLAQEVSRLYQLSLDSMRAVKSTENQSINFNFPSDWIKFVTLKAAHFLAVAQYRKSCVDLTNHDHGVEVSRLQIACTALSEALNKVKSSPHPETLVAQKDSQGLMTMLQKTLESSRRDNDLIYLKEVPPPIQLPEIQPFSVVKPVIPPTIQDPLNFLGEGKTFGRRLFEFVVPYRLYRAKGIYQDRKQDHLKTALEDQAKAIDQQMIEALHSMNLPGSLEAIERPINPPPSILRNSAELRQLDASQALSNLSSEVQKVSSSNCQALSKISNDLDEEEEQFYHHQAYYGTGKWSMPESVEVNRNLRAKEAQLKNALTSATQSDQILSARYQTWFRAIQLLCQGEEIIRKAIPQTNLPSLFDHSLSLPSSSSSLALSDPRKLRLLLDELDDLRSFRNQILHLAQQFGAQDELKDDGFERLKKISGFESTGSIDSLKEREQEDVDLENFFEEELKIKYSSFEDQLKKKSRATTKTTWKDQPNETFLMNRTQDPTTIARQNLFQELELGYHEYYAITKNLQEGLEFHKQFSKYIEVLKEEVKVFTKEREETLKELKKKIYQLESISEKYKGEADVSLDNKDRSDYKGKKKELNNNEAEIQRQEGDGGSSASINNVKPGVYDPNKHGPVKFI
ncbi:BRO1-like domain-domain-containing protein [Phakopsora pachyrhizi]|uniref:BRO1-like domain-domain-containing protein n=1 Tax=Phakopsora pachyrhizi TaxID=170000 RepID=A0AAV0B6N3_PHAPC|nr:BRO1-like domain-domain-containing protein [Phakopsora pachyrhizi]